MYLTLNYDIKTKLNWAKDYLRCCSVATPELDAEILLSHILRCKRAELYIGGGFFEEGFASRFEHLVKLRGTRYPLQYITGSVNFMGLELKIKEGVFIPRPETELLVERVLNMIREQRTLLRRSFSEGRTNGELRVLDLCTGCGNIAISLAKFSTTAEIVASDNSDEAIAVAEENIMLHGCERVRLVKSNLFENIDERQFDIIISNPPYISEADLKTLMPELFYEPSVSVYGGADGLYFYRRILEDVGRFLKKDGYLIVEIGYDQSNPIREILDSKTLFLQEVVKDYNGIDRVMVIKPPHQLMGPKLRAIKLVWG